MSGAVSGAEDKEFAADRDAVEEDLFLRVVVFGDDEDGFLLDARDLVWVGGLHRGRKPRLILGEQLPDGFVQGRLVIFEVEVKDKEGPLILLVLLDDLFGRRA